MQALKMTNLDYMDFIISKLSADEQAKVRAAIKDVEDTCAKHHDDVAAIAVSYVVTKYKAKHEAES